MAPTATSSASTAPKKPPTKRGKYWTMTLEKKAAIIREVESGRCQAEVARAFKISKQTVSDYVRNKVKIKKAAEKSTGSRQKNVTKGRHPKLEEALHVWLKATVAKRAPVSGDILKRKAETLALQMKIKNCKFTDGWLRNFKKRYGLVFKKQCVKSGAVDRTVVKNCRAERLHALLRQYSPDDTFNCDETGLFYKMFPEKTLALSGDPCHGGKHSKERVTVMVGSNMSGTEKLPMLVIGKSKNPRCFKGIRSLPVLYEANKKAWVTQQLFEGYVRKLDRKFELQKRKVLLFVDNCAAHGHITNLKSIQLEFLPADTTSILQPMNQGVIRNLKAHYRARLLGRMLLCLDSGKTYSVDLLSAIGMLSDAWKAVMPDTLRNCFCHAGFTFDSESTVETEDPVPNAQSASAENLIPYLRDGGLAVPAGVTFDKFTDVDSALDVCADLTDEEIVRQVPEPDSGSESEDDTLATVRPSNVELIQALMVLSSVYSETTTLAEVQNDLIARKRNTVQPIIDRFLEPLAADDRLPTLMDESAHTEDYGGTPPSNLLLGGQCFSTLLVKEEQPEAPAFSACERLYSEGADRLSSSHEHMHVDQATVVVKEEPKGAQPAPTGEVVGSEDCCGISTFTLHLEGEMRDTFTVKQEVDDVSAVSTCEGFYHKDAHCLSSSHDNLVQDGTSYVVVEEEQVESAAPETSEGSWSGLSGSKSSPKPNLEGGWENGTLHIKQELVDPEWERSDHVKSGGLSSSQGQLERGQLGEKERPSNDCRFCPYSSVSRAGIVMHERTHTDRRLFKCPSCPKAFNSKSGLSIHREAHKGEKPYKCETCSQRFVHRWGLKRHQTIHLGLKPFRCSICPKAFRLKSNLSDHERAHRREMPYKCETCDKAFVQKRHLKRHQAVHLDLRPFKCSTCSKAFRLKCTLNTHQRVHKGERPYKCEICDRAYTEKRGLNKHQETHAGEKPFKCPACPKSFCFKSSLDSHEQVHKNRNIYKCESCDKGFAKRWNLYTHQMVHAGQKPYKCPICPKSFSWRSSLNHHERAHKGEKRHKCEFCDRCYTRKQALKMHKMTHTGEKPFKCLTCQAAFRLKSSLNNHERGHKNESLYKCETCKLTFAEKRNLNRHLSIHMGLKP